MKQLEVILLLVVALTLHACGKGPTSSSNPATRPLSAEEEVGEVYSSNNDTDSHFDSKSLSYRCDRDEDKKTIDEEISLNKELLNQCKQFLKNKEQIQVKLEWNCPTTDLVGVKRPLPEKTEISTDISFGWVPSGPKNKTKNQLKAVLTSRNLNEFFSQAKQGDTSYLSCLDRLASSLWGELDRFLNKNTIPEKKACNVVLWNQGWPILKNIRSQLKRQYLTASGEGLSKKIKYPPIVVLSDGPAPKFDENYFCNSVNGSFTERNFPEYRAFLSKAWLENELPLRIRDQKNSCRREYLEQMEWVYLEAEIPKLCKQFPKNSVCIDLRKRTQKIKDILTSLQVEVNSENPSVIRLTDRSRGKCNDLKIGESMYVNREAVFGAPQNYRLTRISEKHYQIALALDFNPRCESEEFKKRKINLLWKKNVQDALTELMPGLVGPQGMHLSVVLDDSSDPLLSKAMAIKVHNEYDSGLRGDYRYLTPEFDQAGLVHEVFHHIGLIDLYSEINSIDIDREAKKETKISAVCRKSTQKKLLMNAQEEAWAEFLDDSSNVPKISLLSEAEFNFIVFPQCEAKNKVYKICGGEAYKSTLSECLPQSKLPPQCRGNRTDWLGKPVYIENESLTRQTE